MIIGELTKLWLHSLKSTFYHFFDDIRDFRRSVELCSVSMNFQKLPCVCVYDCRIWSRSRTTTPFALRDRCDHKRSYEHKFHVIGSYRNFLKGSEVSVVIWENSLLEVNKKGRTSPLTSKREFSQMTTVTSGPSKIFSVASHDMKFIFASFFMIISIFQSKQDDRTTLR